MRTIVFGATKGGTGKTTLCYNVALEAAKKHQVLIADLDPQRSLKAMWLARGDMSNPRLVSNVDSLAQSVRLLTEAGYSREFMFVDTPGSMMPVIRDALGAADAIVLPVQPSPMDWPAQEAFADLVDSLGLKSRMIVVVNRAEGRSDLVDRTREYFAMRTPYPILEVTERADFKRGVETGKAAAERGNKDAGKQIRALWDLITTVMGKRQAATVKQEDKTDGRYH